MNFASTSTTTQQPFTFNTGFNPPSFQPSSTTPSLFQPSQPITSQQQQQQQQLAQVTLKTKYADLPDVYKKELDSIAALIRNQISTAESLHVGEIGSMISDIKAELDSVKKTRGAMEALLEKDHFIIQNLRSMVRKEMDRVEIATRIIDAEKKGPSLDLRFNRVYSTLDYFFEKEEEFRSQAEKYSQRLAELEDHVGSLNPMHPVSPQTVIETVRAQHNSFLLLASRVSELHNAIEKLREEFSVYWQHYFGKKQPPNFLQSKKKSSGSTTDEDSVASLKEYANQFVEPTPMTFTPMPSSSFASFTGNPPTTATTSSTTTTPLSSFPSFGSSSFFNKPSTTTTTTTNTFPSFGSTLKPSSTTTTTHPTSMAPSSTFTMPTFGTTASTTQPNPFGSSFFRK